MITLDVEQGSDAWLQARVGIPTASCFDKIVTPGGKVSGAQRKYLFKLLSEWIVGHPLDDGEKSQYMGRGSAFEADARSLYELQTGRTITRVGFLLRDDGLAGCSPDGLVGEDGLVETKVPGLATHVGYLLGEDALEEYRPQGAGQLLISGRKWVDLFSYSQVSPPKLVRYERDDFVDLMAEQLEKFIVRLKTAREQLLEMGVTPGGMEATDRIAISDQVLAGELLT